LDADQNNVCDREESSTQATQATTQATRQATTVSTAATTTQATQATTPQQLCGSGYYDNDPNCGQGCPTGQACGKSGISKTYQGQTIDCYQCREACPTNDPQTTYYHNDPTCGGNCNASEGRWCFESVSRENCFLCQKPCPNNYYYNDSTCGNQCNGMECAQSTQYINCYWCRNPCPEGYYFNDTSCSGDCDINERCKETTDDCYICYSECDVGYYLNDNTCDDSCEQDEDCVVLSGTQNCYYCAQKGQSTTTQATTTHATTTHATTTTQPAIQCGQGRYDSNNCDGDCDPTCEYCTQYQSYPCYYCEYKECEDIRPGLYDSFSDCMADCWPGGQCNVSDECDHCFECVLYECGNGIVEPNEQCEDDLDCPGYGYCDMDCSCQPDCDAYCSDQGVNGYVWINDGMLGSPNINSQAQCQNWAQQKLQQISEVCFTSCVASASYTYNSVYSCCCVDWNKLPCANCPGQNPVCPTEAQCMATL